jgi:hypothetical protein
MERKIEIKLTLINEFPDNIILINKNGDTFTSRSKELSDFLQGAEEYVRHKQLKVGDAEMTEKLDTLKKWVKSGELIFDRENTFRNIDDLFTLINQIEIAHRKAMELNSIDVDALLDEFKKTDGIKVIYTHNLVLHKFADFIIKQQLNK